MQLIREHNKATAAEAAATIDRLLDRVLASPLPGGVTLQDVQRQWQGNTLHFGVKGRKGLMSTKLQGTVQVTDTHVQIDTEVPGLLAAFVPEARVQAMFNEHFDRVFQSA